MRSDELNYCGHCFLPSIHHLQRLKIELLNSALVAPAPTFFSGITSVRFRALWLVDCEKKSVKPWALEKVHAHSFPLLGMLLDTGQTFVPIEKSTVLHGRF
jgi:hypothetical protein